MSWQGNFQWKLQISADQEEQLYAPVYMLGMTQLESSFAEKDLGILMDTKLNMSWYHTFAVERAKGIMRFFRRHVASRSRKVILYLLAFVRPHLEHSTVLAPQYTRGLDILERGCGKRPQRPWGDWSIALMGKDRENWGCSARRWEISRRSH